MTVIRDCSICLEGDPLSPGLKCCFNCAYDPHKCEVCHRCGHDCPEWKVKTNADYIRSLNDEKLAEFLLDRQRDFCHAGLCHKGETCSGCMQKWLKQSAEDQ